MKNKQIVSFVLAGMLTVSTLFGGDNCTGS